MQHHTSSWTKDVRNHHFPAQRDREIILVSHLHIRGAQVVTFGKAPWTSVLFASAVEREERSVCQRVVVFHTKDPCLRSVCATPRRRANTLHRSHPTTATVAPDGAPSVPTAWTFFSLASASRFRRSAYFVAFLASGGTDPRTWRDCSCQSCSFLSLCSGLCLCLG